MLDELNHVVSLNYYPYCFAMKSFFLYVSLHLKSSNSFLHHSAFSNGVKKLADHNHISYSHISINPT